MKVLIAGGGLGGLTTAIALSRAGIDVSVLEQAPELRDIGSGIQLTPNANHVIDALGLTERVREHAFEPRELRVSDGITGLELGSTAANPLCRELFGEPVIGIHRADLHKELVRRLAELSDHSLRLGARVINTEQNDDGVTATLQTGEVVRGNFLIAADGIHSRIRESLLGPQHARFTGQVAYRMTVPAAAAVGIVGPDISLRMGPASHLLAFWVRAGAECNVMAVTESTWDADGWDIPAELSEVLDAFAGWDAGTLQVLAAAQGVHKWALLERQLPERWGKNRIALLGDACHAMLPYLAQGAAMAIEDGWQLAQILADAEDIVTVVPRYQAVRDDRIRRVHDTIVRNIDVYHQAEEDQRSARNAQYESIKAGGLERAFFDAGYAWLYAYNPVATIG